jgi:ketosteroid isomerase-like protein
MAGENLQRIQRARAGEKIEALYTLLAEDVVWDLSRSPFPEAGVYHGIDAVRSWFSGLRDAFGEVHYEVEKEGEFGDQVVLLLHLGGRGPGSQIPVDYRFAPVFTFRDGKIVRMDRYDDWASATAAMGLSE